MLQDFLKLALNNLKRRKLRSWLTMLGIFIGIAAIVSLISLGNGLQTAITGQFASLSTDKLTIQNAGTGLGPPGSTSVERLNSHDVSVIKKVKGVEEVIPRLLRQVKITYNKRSSFYYAGDIPEEDKKRKIVYDSLNLKAEKGRLLTSDDSGKVILGSRVAEGTDFNKKIDIGRKIKIQDKYFEVIGILKKSSNFQMNNMIIMLNNDLKNLLDIRDEYDFIVVQVEKNEKPEIVAERIEKALRKDRNLKEGEEDFSVETPLKAIKTVNQVLGAINWVVWGIAFISLIVGGVGVANTMYTSVLERKKEIGTMKAVGARNSDILEVFLLESGLLGFIGGLIGILMGAGLAIGLSEAANSYFGFDIIQVDLSMPFLISVLVFSFLLGILFGAIPSYQASKLKPIEALRG